MWKLVSTGVVHYSGGVRTFSVFCGSVQEYIEEIPGYEAGAYAQPGMDFAQPGATAAVMDSAAVRVPVFHLYFIDNFSQFYSRVLGQSGMKYCGICATMLERRNTAFPVLDLYG